MKKKIATIITTILLFIFISTKNVYGYKFGDITMSIWNGVTGVVETVTDPIGTVLTMAGNWLIDNIIILPGDLMQASINGLQTYTLNGKSGFVDSVMYTDSELNTYKEINQYINLNKSYSKNLNNYKEPNYKVTIKDLDQGLESDTSIPFCVVDFYSLVAGKVAATDINFLTVDKSLHNNKEGFWDFISKIAVSLMIVTMYLSAAALLTALIVHGIVVVGNVYNDPRKRARHQEGFNRFAKSVLMLVSAVLAMSLVIFFSRMMIRSVLNDTELNEFPIQVTAEEAGKTFSTNITGYFRFKAQMDDNISEKFSSAIVYTVLAFFNFALGLLMILRFLAIIVLSVWGIALAAIYIWKKENFNGKFIDWGIAYGSIAIFPLIIAILEWALLMMCCQ